MNGKRVGGGKEKEMNDEQIECEGKQIDHEVKVIGCAPGDFGTWNWEPEDDVPDWDDEVPEWEESV